ncbi:DUF2238 domain-containing protein [Polaribacter haliotis]|uniref:DUF2238 domain-containing protein n=1 Tax=Polaribacter haliotis TaxID=1888915 RepID=A0A7L8ACG6_9FLAO|nr:DUF2238 domain-containing protein [Polaribacter haliotis]QOD59579.1 DUF2238 domain-containing protein [Polaribacter haliotis]
MLRKIWITIFFSVLIWSAIKPYNYFTWFLEVSPAIIGFIVLWRTEKPFPLTRLVYILILIHCIILMVGGHYTYAEVPLFNTIQEMLEMSRNSYDKVGHLAQGFIPAMIAREIFIRKKLINSKAWENFLIVMFCLGFSAFYELIEWFVAAFSGESAEDFLGTQGYIWDTQSDMALALLGAILALVTLSKIHNRQLEKLDNKV